MTAGSDTASAGRSSRKVFVIVGLLVALALAGVASFYASGDPDGLTKVSEDEGFAESEKAHQLEDSPLAGYSTEDVESDRLSGGVAGVIGVGVTFAIAGGAVLLVRRRAQSAGSDDQDADDRDAGGQDETPEVKASHL